MFSSQIHKNSHSWALRLRTMALGSTVLIATIAALVSARTTPGGWLLICAAIFLSALFLSKEKQTQLWAQAIDFKNPLILSLMAFFIYAAFSSLWAQNPLAPLRAATFALFTTLLTRTAITLVRPSYRQLSLFLAEGLWLGLFIALTYFLIELLSGQIIKLTLYNALSLGPGDIKPTAYFTWNADGTLASISLNDMTRNTTPITMFMWSAMLAALAALSSPYGKSMAGIILALSISCVALSPHETSKLALLMGLLFFALAYLSRQWTAIAMTTLWSGACILILPAAMLAHDLQLHDQNSGLQNSARARIIIWNETATQTLKSPIIGVGARMTYELGPKLLEEKPKNKNEWFPAKLSRHAHNAFLQTWYELGAIGIILLLACGVAMVRAITRLPHDVQPFAFATFASATTIAASSYGMWQAWFMGLFAMTPILFTIAQTASTRLKQHS